MRNQPTSSKSARRAHTAPPARPAIRGLDQRDPGTYEKSVFSFLTGSKILPPGRFTRKTASGYDVVLFKIAWPPAPQSRNVDARRNRH
jgi:hypothetical protein